MSHGETPKDNRADPKEHNSHRRPRRFNVLVAGGGIAGLEIVRQLIEIASVRPSQQFHISLLEKKSYWGGRVKSMVTSPTTFYEAGASRIASTHRRVASLVQLLGLRRIETGIELSTDQLAVLPAMKRARAAFLRLDGNDPTSLKRVTWADVVRAVHATKREADAMLDSWGFASMVHKMNAYDFWEHAIPHYCAPSYYTLEGGLASLVGSLAAHNKAIALKHGVRLDMETGCVLKRIRRIGKSGAAAQWVDGEQKAHERRFDAVFLAMPADALQRLAGLPPELEKRLGAVSQNPLLRCYVRPDRCGVRLEAASGTELGRATASNDPEWVQVSYTGHEAAMHLNRLLMASNAADTLRRIARPVVPRWTEMDMHFWKAGTHSWLPQQPADSNYDFFVQPEPTHPLFVAGSCFSRAQHWMEGALETACDAVRALCRHWRADSAQLSARCSARVRCLRSSSSKHMATRKKAGHPNRRWTMDEVESKTKGGHPHVVYQGKVYNITDITHAHPGGAGILRSAAGTDITRAFHSVGHTAAAAAWMSDYCVGYLR